MLYKHLIAILEDYAELVPSSPDGPSTHSRWIITPETGARRPVAGKCPAVESVSVRIQKPSGTSSTRYWRMCRVSSRISSRRRSYDALKAILLTLWVSHLVGTPVRYSRRKNDYVRDARYGEVFFRYDRIIPLVDALGKSGLHQAEIGMER